MTIYNYHCPICGSDLSEEIEYDEVLKRCSSTDDHNYSFVYSYYFRTYLYVRLIFLDKTDTVYNVKWDFTTNSIRISTNGDSSKILNIPMFDADFSNLEKTISKIKTYILFS